MFNEERIMRQMIGGKAVFSDIYEEESIYRIIQLENDRFERIERAKDKGVGLRILVPWKTYYASTTSFREEDVFELAKNLKKVSETEGGDFKKDVEKRANYPFLIEEDPKKVPLEKILSLLKKINEETKKRDRHIRQVRIGYRDTLKKIRMVTSNGEIVEDERVQLMLSLFVVGEKDGEIQTSYEAEGGFYGFEQLTEEKIERMVDRTVNRLKGLFKAREAERGRKPVVLASEAGGTMIHEAIGHGLEADLAMEGLSCYKGMIGEKIASHLITIVDDPTLPFKRGSYAFDDEGIPSQRTVLVEKGVLVSYLFDRFYALKYGKSSTGNGRRESFRFKPIPRMSNTFILPGNDDPEKIISSIDHGILVLKMGGGEVDTVTGDFVFEIQEGYLLERGGKGEMIKNATLMGNGPQILKEIDMVGKDLGFSIGTCGKDGQGVPVSDAQPTLRIPELIIGGRA